MNLLEDDQNIIQNEMSEEELIQFWNVHIYNNVIQQMQ